MSKSSGMRSFFHRLLLPVAATAMSATFQLSIARGAFRGTPQWVLWLLWVVSAGLWAAWILTHDKVALWLSTPFGRKITIGADKIEARARQTEGASDSWIELFKEKQRLEEELASLEEQVPSAWVQPLLSLGKDKRTLLLEKIGRKKKTIKQIEERMKHLVHD
jgi:hypothetical protein